MLGVDPNKSVPLAQCTQKSLQGTDNCDSSPDRIQFRSVADYNFHKQASVLFRCIHLACALSYSQYTQKKTLKEYPAIYKHISRVQYRKLNHDPLPANHKMELKNQKTSMQWESLQPHKASIISQQLPRSSVGKQKRVKSRLKIYCTLQQVQKCRKQKPTEEGACVALGKIVRQWA